MAPERNPMNGKSTPPPGDLFTGTFGQDLDSKDFPAPDFTSPQTAPAGAPVANDDSDGVLSGEDAAALHGDSFSGGEPEQAPADDHTEAAVVVASAPKERPVPKVKAKAEAGTAGAAAGVEIAFKKSREALRAMPDNFDGGEDSRGLQGANAAKMVIAHYEPLIEQLVKSNLALSADYARAMRRGDEYLASNEKLVAEIREAKAAMETQAKAYREKADEVVKATVTMSKAQNDVSRRILEGVISIKTTGDHNNVRLTSMSEALSGILVSLRELAGAKFQRFFDKLDSAISAFTTVSTGEAVLKFSLAAITLLLGVGVGFGVCYWGMN